MKPPETISIGARQVEAPQSQFRPADIFYILFRHKWKIILLSLTGFAVATYLFLTHKAAFVSEARLLILYVQESRSVSPMDSGDSIKSPDSRGDNILNSEMDLITSLDLAEEVAAAVGPSNIVSDESIPVSSLLPVAASVVRQGIVVDAPRKSNVLRVSYQNQDPTTTQTILSNLVTGYLRMHARVHRALGVMEDLGRQAELRRSDLQKVEAQLREIKDSLGIASIEEAIRANAEQLARVKQELLSAESQLAEARATLGYHTTTQTNSTNSVVGPIAPPVISREMLAAYESLLSQIDALKKRHQDLLLQYTEEHPFVTTLRDRIGSLDGERLGLEEKEPGLATYSSRQPARDYSSVASPSGLVDRSVEFSRVAGLEARWNTLQRQLAKLQDEQIKLNVKEPEITELERKRTSFEKDYRYYSTAVDQARVDATLTAGRLANISVIQSASAPSPDTKKFYQLIGGILVGGLLIGLTLAFILEFYADQTLRKPSQIARSLNIPVFLTVPRLALSEKPIGTHKLLPPPSNTGDHANLPADDDASEDSKNPLMAYAEALRDRVIMHFQLRELHHKPKLVGITSCGKNAGATTLATHLAASLSETGEGNVLYIDANPSLGPSVQAFYRGKQAAGVSAVLDQGDRSAAKVHENFYMAALNETGLPGKVGVLPKKLANLLPKMKASDFDYIIFDLPPVTQTSATARVAGLLDMTLLVLESEKTHGDLAKQVTGLLKQSRADVAAVLNKHRRYIPHGLDPDL